MYRFLKNVLFCALIVSLGYFSVLDAQAFPPVKTEQEGVDPVPSTPSIDVSKVGYAACRGLVSYGGKVFAVWLAGTNPLSATVLLVGIAGGQVGGRGFDAVAQYLESRNITPPTEAGLEELMDEFVEIEEEPITEIGEDENGEMVALDENRVPVEVEFLPEYREPEALTYVQWFGRMAYNALGTGYQGAVGVVNQLPRMGAATITGTLAGTIGQMVGGDVLATAANAAVNNLAGQVYDGIEVVVLNGQLEEHTVTEQTLIYNTGAKFEDSDFEPVIDDQDFLRVRFYDGWEELDNIIIEDYNPNPAEAVNAEAELFNLMDGFELVNVQEDFRPGDVQGSVFF